MWNERERSIEDIHREEERLGRQALSGAAEEKWEHEAGLSGLPRVLLLASDLFSVHSIRVRARQAGLSLIFECATTEDEFLRRIEAGPKIAACCIKRLSTLSGKPSSGRAFTAGAIADLVATRGIAMFIIGGDTQEERAILDRLRGKFSGSLHRSQLEWLPLFLERTLREQHFERERAKVEQHADQVAHVLRESQKLLTVGRLAGSIAHEINNPLEAVTNLLYLIGLDAALTPASRSYLQIAQHELERVIVISKQTLNFYRETQTPQLVKLSELLDEVLVLYSRKLHMKKIVVTRRYDAEESVLVFPGEMRQIFSNLVANAIDASPSDGRLTVRVHPSRQWMDAAVRGVRVTIADNGSGMSEAVRRQLGKAFFTTKGQRGTGLGLWVSKAIVKRYGGDLKLRSSDVSGRTGTTFSMFIPTNLRPQIVEPPPAGRYHPTDHQHTSETDEGLALSASADETQTEDASFPRRVSQAACHS